MGDATTETNGHVDPGISVRNGPVEDGDVEMEDVGSNVNARGANKRKTRPAAGQRKSYSEPESSEEDKPLVRHIP